MSIIVTYEAESEGASMIARLRLWLETPSPCTEFVNGPTQGFTLLHAELLSVTPNLQSWATARSSERAWTVLWVGRGAPRPCPALSTAFRKYGDVSRPRRDSKLAWGESAAVPLDVWKG
jgi:hypothetical protein